MSTIFQGSSESSIGFTVPEGEADRAVSRVSRAFRHEIETGVIDGVSARKGMAVIAVVGEGMAGTPGIAARVFSALEAGGLNVVAIAQGSSERNISVVVDAADTQRALRAAHAGFYLSEQTISIGLVGAGASARCCCGSSNMGSTMWGPPSGGPDGRGVHPRGGPGDSR